MSNLAPDSSPTASSSTAPNARGSWKLPLLLLVVLVTIVAARSAQQRGREVERDSKPAPPPAAAHGKAVSLSIDFGNGSQRTFDAIAWQSGMTVDDLMTAASRSPNGISYRVGGDGEMMLLENIDGVENEWGGSRFWLYRVNDALADRSIGVYELQPGDRVLWKFSEKE